MRKARPMPTKAMTAPPRMASVLALSPSGFRNRAMLTSRVMIQTRMIEFAMTAQRIEWSGVVTLK